MTKLMKRIFFGICALGLLLTQNGCKKFLDVKPIEKLSGNDFFQDRKQVESNLWDAYGLLRDKIGSCPFLAVGDMRNGMLKRAIQDGTGRLYFNYLAQNDLLTLLDPTAPETMEGTFHWTELVDWRNFYRVVQAANALYYEVGKGTIPGLSQADIKHYQAEAVFLRCMTYFFMIHTWGDVPYYTDAYHEDPLPRTDMVEIANNCIEDLKAVLDDLPWTYNDPAYLGIRASKGGALALMMNLAMWNAGFDKDNAAKYYQETADWGGQIVNSKAYSLIPIEDFHTLFKGRTNESLFDIAQNSNYNEIIMYQTFADMVLHYPYKRPASTHQWSFSYYSSTFLLKLYPPGQSDARQTYWFDENMLADDGNFQFLKFTNIYAVSDDEDVNPDNDLIIFRYAGALLLRAEALAELGQNQEAIQMLNLVRARAKAAAYSGSPDQSQDLKDAIFAERAKELMGEGFYFYDLVRTGRIKSSEWANYPMTQAELDQRAWTWPLSTAAQNNNPFIQLNSYWLK